MVNRPPSATTVDTSLTFPIGGNYTITSGFGPRTSPTPGASTNHMGVDIAAPTGTPVLAATSGTVTHAGASSGFGNLITIDNGNGVTTQYGHLSQINVTQGQTVVAGEAIGAVGSTGISTGSHLHFGEKVNGQYVNPLTNTTVTTNPTTSALNAANASSTGSGSTTSLPTPTIDVNSILNSLNSGGYFETNAANNYDNLTYHWRLFMLSDSTVVGASSASSLSDYISKIGGGDQVTVAESGMTTYGISEVVLNAIVGTDFQARSTNYTNITMKVGEPNGVSFLDSLVASAAALGVSNYYKCPYFLELTFKGYDQSGTINTSPFANDFANGGRWVWQVVINNIAVHLNAGGGTYELSMIPQSDQALTSEYCITPALLMVKGNTVGDWWSDLCNSMNTEWGLREGNWTDGKPKIRYTPKFHAITDYMTSDEIMKMPLMASQIDFSPTKDDILPDPDTHGFNVPKGTALSDILDKMMGACEQAAKMAMDNSTDLTSTTTTADAVNSKGYREGITFRMETEVKFLGYDPIFNHYVQDITLHIYGIRNYKAILSTVDSTSITKPDVQKNVLATMAKNKFLRKRYDYLYTGLNTEVLDIDVGFNLAWQAVLPRLAATANTQTSQHGLAEQASNAISYNNTAYNDVQKDKTDTAALLSKVAQVQATGSTADKISLTNQLKDQTSVNNFNNVLLQTTQNSLTSLTAAAVQQQQTQMAGQKVSGSNYAEELVQNTGTAPSMPAISVRVDPDTDSTDAGKNNSGQAIYGAVLNQLYSPYTADFQQINMTIRGDPFWIGPGSFEKSQFRSSDTYDDSYPNFPAGPSTIVFHMRYPVGMDDSDQVIIKDNETVTGVFQVNQVEHRFSGGLFTQQLQAVRLQTTQVIGILNSSSGSSTSTPTTNSTTPTTVSSPPQVTKSP